MTELDDHKLLAEFARSESEAAFDAIVERHLNLVYSAALRFTGNPHNAQEITQTVFIILARKAGKLPPRTVLSGWLYQAARLTAANFVKGEIRRQRREQEAYMQSTLTEPDAAAWKQIAPLLDEAMGQLGETDRNAVVLRFFENRTAREVGAALKLTEAAAHMRVNRALEKLRKIFTKRGVTLTTTLIAGAVAANSVQAAPMGVAATISATAAKGAVVATTITTLVKGTMNTMKWMKLKFAAGAGAALLLAGGAVTVAISQISNGGDETTATVPQTNVTTQIASSAQASLTVMADANSTPEGVEWKLVELNGKAFTAPDGGGVPTLTFDAAKKNASGLAGINRYFGSYKLDGDKLKFGPLGSTFMAGPQAAMDAETVFFKMLDSVNAWKIADGRLQLLHDDKVIARFSGGTP